MVLIISVCFVIFRLGPEHCSLFRKQCSMFDALFDVQDPQDDLQDRQNHRIYQDHPSGGGGVLEVVLGVLNIEQFSEQRTEFRASPGKMALRGPYKGFIKALERPSPTPPRRSKRTCKSSTFPAQLPNSTQNLGEG